MKKFKVIAITAIVAALFVCATVLLLTSLNNEGTETSVYSPVSVNPPSEDITLPEENSKPENLDQYALAVEDILANLNNLKTSFASEVDREYIEDLTKLCGREAIIKLGACLAEGEVGSKTLRNAIGYTENALLSIMDEERFRTTVLENTEDGSTELVFVGDTAFANGYSVMNRYKSRNKGIEGLVSSDVLGILRSADIAMANNEFTLSDRGSPIPDKKWTFRGDPKNVSIFHELGIDIVGLANNHAFDYGPDALTDTLATLDAAGIARLGAGEDINEARAPYYYVINGYKIAIVAGSAIDPYSTRGATEKQSGVFQIFDTVSMCNVIGEAKANADYVIAYVHWGLESTTNLTNGQKSMGKAFVDAGADVVVGMHSHCMQGLEYYNGKLIVYSLGNFVFSSYKLTCGMLKVSISPEGDLTNVYYPMMQADNFTYINSGADGEAQLNELKGLLINAHISDDYTVTEKK
jgi:poly-gamma-glutamate synthesis protein (capsule biosynthesis protein)